MKVRDVMTTSVASVRRNDSLSVAAQFMWDCDCGSIPVKDDAGQRVIGMITDRDICMATWSRDRAPSSISVSEVMSNDLYSSSPDDNVSSAEDLMRLKQIRRVPVLDEDRNLVGILSLADIATEAQRNGGRAATSEFAPAEIAVTLANICQPRPSPQPSASV